VAQQMPFEGVQWIFPTAPTIPVTLNGGQGLTRTQLIHLSAHHRRHCLWDELGGFQAGFQAPGGFNDKTAQGVD